MNHQQDQDPNKNNNLVTQSEFARVIGVSRQHVSQLKSSGRLVMDGDHVLVSQSRARVKATADPNRDDVRQRHAEDRAATTKPPHTPSEASVTTSYQQSRAVKEMFAAKTAKLSYEREVGTVVSAEAVRRIALDAGATLRTMLEAMPDQLAPQMAAIGDREEIHALLTEHIEHALQEAATKMAKMSMPS